MNIESLLKYQKLDEELFKVEQKLKNSPARKKAGELTAIAKKAQTRSTELENEAEKLINEISDIKEKYNLNKSKADEMLSTNLDNMSFEDIEKYGILKNKIMSNLGILEKMLQKNAENINHILSEFNKTKKAYDEARNQYAVCKQKIDEETKLLEPEKEKIEKQLLVLEKDVAPDIMAEYKKRRNDNIFPVIVPLEGNNFCGRCRMELPKVAISRIKEKGVITCEHCKRLVYQK
ncbi:MAG: zinc ribbon domain-containing protein [Candidatus Caccovivens sp.]